MVVKSLAYFVTAQSALDGEFSLVLLEEKHNDACVQFCYNNHINFREDW